MPPQQLVSRSTRSTQVCLRDRAPQQLVIRSTRHESITTPLLTVLLEPVQDYTAKRSTRFINQLFTPTQTKQLYS